MGVGIAGMDGTGAFAGMVYVDVDVVDMPGADVPDAGIDGVGGLGLRASRFSSSRILREAKDGVSALFLAASMRWRIVGLFTQ